AERRAERMANRQVEEPEPDPLHDAPDEQVRLWDRLGVSREDRIKEWEFRQQPTSAASLRAYRAAHREERWPTATLPADAEARLARVPQRYIAEWERRNYTRAQMADEARFIRPSQLLEEGT
ncbi:MAG: hypothetical protein ACREJF_07750, partial [Candidatus Methylomirabilales bacterium]